MRVAAAVSLFALTVLQLTASAPASRVVRSGTEQSGPAARSVWDGVYTDAQQKRGEPVYMRECSLCHGETLKGGEGTLPLAGPEFLDRWNGRTVADLFENIRKTMPPPPDRPGRLTPQQHADVIAYILKVNKIPLGTDTELPTDLARLRNIRMTVAPQR